jgi:Ca2+-binding RTX toxin-like protein
VAAAVFALATAAPSTATVHPEAFPPQGSGLSFAFYGTTADDDIRIALGIDPEVHHIEDPAGVIGAVGDCQPVTPTAADCHAFDGRYLGRMKAGNDDVVMSDASVDGKLYGGDGFDYLSGSGGDEKIYGGGDNDYLSGDVGADLVDGGHGNDTLAGGINSDRIRAVDGERDSRIDCGPGSNDVAWIDRKIDDRPWGCERVVRVR